MRWARASLKAGRTGILPADGGGREQEKNVGPVWPEGRLSTPEARWRRSPSGPGARGLVGNTPTNGKGLSMMDEKLMVRLFQRPATAFHEAGHAVVALAMGVKVTRVWIDEEARGCTEMDGAARFDPSRAWEYAPGRRQLFAT